MWGKIRIMLWLQYLATVTSVVWLFQINVVTSWASPFYTCFLNPLFDARQMKWNSALLAVPNFTSFADWHHANHAFELPLHHTLTDILGVFRLFLVCLVS